MDKQATIQTVKDEFNKLLTTVQALDDMRMTQRFYGDWSVKDVLAHIAGWHEQMTGAMDRMARGERPTPEGVDYSDANAWNAKFASAMAPQSPATVLAALQQSFANYTRAAQAIPEDRYGEGKTINRILETSGYAHYREHLQPIEEFAKQGA